MNSTVKTIVFWVVIAVCAVLLWELIRTGQAGPKDKEINFSQFMSEVNTGNVKEVTITGIDVTGKYKLIMPASTHRTFQLSRHDQDAGRQRRHHHLP